jgi:hypothetical protein
MRALQSRLPPKDRLSQERRQALQLLACSPRGAIEEVLMLRTLRTITESQSAGRASD